MWTKEAQTEASSQASERKSSAVSFGSGSAPTGGLAPRSFARLGSSLQIKGQITGTENLQIDGNVDGPISLNGHQLLVGATAQLNSEIHAGEVVVYGRVVGNLQARDRVDIKKDGSVFGDISTARISIEDGAQFRGRIEIDPAKSLGANSNTAA